MTATSLSNKVHALVRGRRSYIPSFSLVSLRRVPCDLIESMLSMCGRKLCLWMGLALAVRSRTRLFPSKYCFWLSQGMWLVFPRQPHAGYDAPGLAGMVCNSAVKAQAGLSALTSVVMSCPAFMWLSFRGAYST